MLLSDALILASTMPLCRKAWRLADGSGCILTALARVVGVELEISPGGAKAAMEVLRPHFPLLFHQFPILTTHGNTQMTILWIDIIRRFDGQIDADGDWRYRPESVSEIASWVRGIEIEQEANQAVEVSA